MSKTATDFFTGDAALSYDERNKKLSPILDCLHFLMGLVLKDRPSLSRVICVGAGTGAEILYLARLFPEWKFLALDPSPAMLAVCRERLEKAGVADRCEFFQGFIEDLPPQSEFDMVLSLLVAHFVGRDERLSFFQNMVARLREGGYLVNAEISFDLDSDEYGEMLRNWGEVHKLMGATEESFAKLPEMLKEGLTVLPPKETEDLMRLSGVNCPIRFFQAFMICGWHGQKRSV